MNSPRHGGQAVEEPTIQVRSRQTSGNSENAFALGQTALFRKLEPAKLRELAKIAQQRRLGRGEVLFLAGAPAQGLYAIVSGTIRAFRVNNQGRQQTVHVETAWATLAEVPAFDDGPYPATAVAEEPSVVLFLDKRDILNFMYRNPEVAVAALKVLAKRLRQHAALVDALALREVGQRLARLLLVEGRASGKHCPAGLRLDLSMSNQQLAERVGSVREVISRTLGRLEKRGLIVLHGTRTGKKMWTVTIPDPAALASYSGEDGLRTPDR